MTQILEIPSLPEIEPIYALKFVQFSRTSCEQTPRQTQRGERAGGRGSKRQKRELAKFIATYYLNPSFIQNH